MKIQDEMEVPVLSQGEMDMRQNLRAAARKRMIVGDSADRSMAVYAPNEHRACCEDPAVFDSE
jgi:hypothetical protein